MISTYKTIKGQNIYDVSVQLYGSIEGVFDLLMVNDWLDMNIVFSGEEVQYHTDYIQNEEIVDYLNDNNISVVHGNGKDYEPIDESDVRYVIGCVPHHNNRISFTTKGTGTLTIMWGDNAIDTYNLNGNQQVIEHEYRRRQQYKIVVLGNDASLMYWHVDDHTEIYKIKKTKSIVVGLSKIGSTTEFL